MNVRILRRLSVLLGVLAVALVTQQLVANRLAHSKLEREAGRQDGLEDQLDRIRWRMDARCDALQAYTEGRTELADAARRFRQADVWDAASAERVRRLWPDAPSDDERYAAEVVRCLRDRAGMCPADVAALSRAEADFWQAFGRSPDPVG